MVIIDALQKTPIKTRIKFYVDATYVVKHASRIIEKVQLASHAGRNKWAAVQNDASVSCRWLQLGPADAEFTEILRKPQADTTEVEWSKAHATALQLIHRTVLPLQFIGNGSSY